MKSKIGRQKRLFILLFVFLGLIVAVWNLTSLLSNFEKIAAIRRYIYKDDTPTDTQRILSLKVDIETLINKISNISICMEVAADPKGFWRSQFHNGSLDTSQKDICRMTIAIRCGILYPEYLHTPPVTHIYPFEYFYLSEPPLLNVTDASDENKSEVTLCNSSLLFQVGDTVAFKIQMVDGNGHFKTKGGDQIRAWFEDSNTTQMAARVTDLNNGTYLASAPLPWAGKLRLRVALAYPREYLRAVLYIHRVQKSFRPHAAIFRNSLASEATPCYHTQVIPGFDASELCDLTTVNGAPWFCGRPIKTLLNCSDYASTVVAGDNHNYPLTDAEMEILNRSRREPRIRLIPSNFELTVKDVVSNRSSMISCNKALPNATWAHEGPTGYFSRGTWHPLSCEIPEADYYNCFKNKKVAIFGDSNGRTHYYHLTEHFKCKEIVKALSKKWHKPLLCVHEGNNFSVRWEPHANPFINGRAIAELGSLTPTARAIDGIPSEGRYLIILNHYFHLTVTHLSALDFMYRFIKDALVRLFQRNPNVQVVLQGPFIAWHGWDENFAAGDMFAPVIMDLQREIFDDIKDKVVFVSSWDFTIAVKNYNFHPPVNINIFDTIVGFMCGR